MSKKIFIKSYGCQMNEYDSAKIADLFASDNFVRIHEPQHADLIILNTCSVRAKAEEKMFSDLGRYRNLKKKHPQLIIGVGGCVASQEKDNIIKRMPCVDMVFGPQTLHRLPQMYAAASKSATKTVDVSFPKIEKFDYFPEPHAAGPTAYITIMEGCNKFCSYCIVPYTRGREISRPFKAILQEVISLAKQKVKEITLLGQNVNAYKAPNADNQNQTLADLIRAIAAIPEIERIRFVTSHPSEFTDDLIAVYAAEKKLVSHLHLPVQSGSDRILKLMRRDYTANDYQEIVRKLRLARPEITIASDFIVGFPGETADDFAQTMALIRAVNFDASFSFIYSPRPNTKAAQLEDNVTLAIKKERLAILQNQIAAQARRISQAMLGTVQQVLVTSQAKKNSHQLSGRTENNRVVNFIGSENLIGTMVAVKIIAALPNSLRGEIA